jgi:hypothetical protein
MKLIYAIHQSEMTPYEISCIDAGEFDYMFTGLAAGHRRSEEIIATCITDARADITGTGIVGTWYLFEMSVTKAMVAGWLINDGVPVRAKIRYLSEIVVQ